MLLSWRKYVFVCMHQLFHDISYFFSHIYESLGKVHNFECVGVDKNSTRHHSKVTIFRVAGILRTLSAEIEKKYIIIHRSIVELFSIYNIYALIVTKSNLVLGSEYRLPPWPSNQKMIKPDLVEFENVLGRCNISEKSHVWY